MNLTLRELHESYWFTGNRSTGESLQISHLRSYRAVCFGVVVRSPHRSGQSPLLYSCLGSCLGLASSGRCIVCAGVCRVTVDDFAGVQMMGQGAFEMTWLHAAIITTGGLVGFVVFWLPYFMDRGLV